MNRLQALLLALELSAIVWIGVILGGKWLVDESDINFDFGTTASIK